MHLCLIILFPLLGFLFNGLYHLMSVRLGKKANVILGGRIATLAMAGSFVVSFLNYLGLKELGGTGAIEQTLFNWMKLGALNIDFALRLDSLSVVFALVITGVGTLIHLYSISYMSHDEGGVKYFAYLNLFCFMMLNLVLGATLPHVFLGWEGVGLASYLLIGFWYQDPLKFKAGQKAFIMNRIGDLGFLIAMFIAFQYLGTLDLVAINQSPFPNRFVTAFGLLIFFACTGKSAQIPLFTWLPDAMAGPTPVSALIHAATMVTSGVYLLTRLNLVISSSDIVMSTIAFTGGATALISAILACSQSDIKKILAYSTISQLGFMFLACGVGAFDAGVFHVMTHAFFKALLFLAAGSVIHALHNEQNIFKMGGLRTKLPITFITFTAGWAAILGLPPFSGFFSKDEIIYQALNSPHGDKALFAMALAAALLTAFYMTRLYVLVFFGKSRMTAEVEKKVHEAPLLMTLPLVILAALSLIGGFFGSPIHLEAQEEHTSLQFVVMGVSVCIAFIGAFIAYKKYSGKVNEEQNRDVFHIDQAFSFFFGRGLKVVAGGMFRFVEVMIVQRIIRLSSAVVELSGNFIRVTQVGSAQAYLMMMLIAIFGILTWIYLGVGQYGRL